MPMDVVCEAGAGESVLEVALANEINIQHACGGFCACSTCHIQVQEGKDSVSAMEDEEQGTLELADGRTDKSRLACQTKVNGDITVFVVNQE